jgi:hypothetical protein
LMPGAAALGGEPGATFNTDYSSIYSAHLATDHLAADHLVADHLVADLLEPN